MKVKAAIALEKAKPLIIDYIDLEGPKKGEVLVEIKSTGVCHTDAYTLSGDDPEGIFPSILGHEGAGIVVEIGQGVTTLKKDDHILLSDNVYYPTKKIVDSFLSKMGISSSYFPPDKAMNIEKYLLKNTKVIFSITDWLICTFAINPAIA